MRNYDFNGIHDFEKTNLVTIKGRGMLYDLYTCKHCGLTGKRVGTNNYVTAEEQVCTNTPSYIPKQIKVFVDLEWVFGIQVGAEFTTVPPPCGFEHLEGIWVYAEQRREAVRLLRGEYKVIELPTAVQSISCKKKTLHKRIRKKYFTILPSITHKVVKQLNH